MKRVPRGFPADHPRADLLKHRSLTAARELESDTVRDVEPVSRTCQWLLAAPSFRDLAWRVPDITHAGTSERRLTPGTKPGLIPGAGSEIRP